jgi:AraC-like DNA-binding protein
MDSPPPDFRLLRFNTDHFPERERLGAWREIVARKLINIGVEPLADGPFEAKVMLRAQHGLRIAGGTIAPSLNRLRRSMTASDADDMALLVNVGGEVVAQLRKREYILRENDALLMSCWETGDYGWREHANVHLIRLPRAALEPLVPDLEEATGRLVPGETDMLRLLINYVSTLFADDDFAMTPGASRIVMSHICDLAALSLGATREAAAFMAGRGRHAARLRVMKADIVRNLQRADLTAARLAAAHRLSPRAVQRLFESEGTTFSAFVLEQRLTRAYRFLSDARFADRNVSAIAFDSGFADVSYFNRTFKKRFGAAPSDVRARIGEGKTDG